MAENTMEIQDISAEEYAKVVTQPFSKFDTAEFVELNKRKVDAVKYLLFRNNKVRFGLVAGIKEQVFLAPFSSTFAIFSEVARDNPIEYYSDAVEQLCLYAGKSGIRAIQFGLPALAYDTIHTTKFLNALVNHGFKPDICDINYEYKLGRFNEGYINTIRKNAKGKLQNSLTYGLSFEKTEDVPLAYEIIKHNRESRGYPLRMTLEEVLQTMHVIPTDFFLVKSSAGVAVAAAMVHHLTAQVLRLVYWGNEPSAKGLNSINFLSFKLFEYYKDKSPQTRLIDIGTASVDGVPNYGLCTFKDSIGCSCSPKWTLNKEIAPK